MSQLYVLNILLFSKFERMAIDVMDIFDQNTNTFMNSIILFNTTSFSHDIDNLQMAVECNCKNFIANRTVQAFLDDIWNGGVKVIQFNVNGV